MQHGGEHIRPHVPAIMQALSAVVQAPDARSEDNEMATDNAISAVGKMCEFQRGVLGPQVTEQALKVRLPPGTLPTIPPSPRRARSGDGLAEKRRLTAISA